MQVEILKIKEDAEELRTVLQHVKPGSVIVRQPDTDWVYFEGGIYGNHFSTDEEKRTQFAIQAAGRAVEKYPTMARAHLRAEEFEGFEQIGLVEVPGYTVRWFKNEPSL